MTRSTLLTIEDLIEELNMGKAVLKFISHRFHSRLSTQIVNDETCYTEQAVATLLKIKKFLDAGMLPEQIESNLARESEATKTAADTQHPVGGQRAIQLDMASASMAKDMFQAYIEKQDRIASAQESLARIEERKADAMEKQAAAEEKKAAAMTNIAQALQEMNRKHSAAPPAMEIVGRAVETLALEQSPGRNDNFLDTHFDEKEDLFKDPVPLEDPFKHQDHEDFADIGPSNMDDLSLLVNETALTPEDIDDLSSLIDSVSDPGCDLDDLESLLEETPPAPEINDISYDIDDLSKLVDFELSSSNSGHDKADDGDDNENDIDDLYTLVKMNPDAPKDINDDLDDLSKLFESVDDTSTDDLDDLSALIEKSEQTRETMDDLSLLVDDDAQRESGRSRSEIDIGMDDLWPLISDEEKGLNTQNLNQEIQDPDKQSVDTLEMDDLSSLITEASENGQTPPDTMSGDTDIFDTHTNDLTQTQSIKPDISPDQDVKKYKAAVMKIIIELKEQGLTAQQTTDRLNQDDVATLSGKPVWSLKAIEKIYGFIDSAK